MSTIGPGQPRLDPNIGGLQAASAAAAVPATGKLGGRTVTVEAAQPNFMDRVGAAFNNAIREMKEGFQALRDKMPTIGMPSMPKLPAFLAREAAEPVRRQAVDPSRLGPSPTATRSEPTASASAAQCLQNFKSNLVEQIGLMYDTRKVGEGFFRTSALGVAGPMSDCMRIDSPGLKQVTGGAIANALKGENLVKLQEIATFANRKNEITPEQFQKILEFADNLMFEALGLGTGPGMESPYTAAIGQETRLLLGEMSAEIIRTSRDMENPLRTGNMNPAETNKLVRILCCDQLILRSFSVDFSKAAQPQGLAAAAALVGTAIQALITQSVMLETHPDQAVPQAFKAWAQEREPDALAFVQSLGFGLRVPD